MFFTAAAARLDAQQRTNGLCRRTDHPPAMVARPWPESDSPRVAQHITWPLLRKPWRHRHPRSPLQPDDTPSCVYRLKSRVFIPGERSWAEVSGIVGRTSLASRPNERAFSYGCGCVARGASDDTFFSSCWCTFLENINSTLGNACGTQTHRGSCFCALCSRRYETPSERAGETPYL